MDTEPKEGWGFPLNSRKAHYFVDTRSLCGGWMYFGKLEPDKISDTTRKDNCAACKRKVANGKRVIEFADKMKREHP